MRTCNSMNAISGYLQEQLMHYFIQTSLSVLTGEGIHKQLWLALVQIIQLFC